MYRSFKLQDLETDFFDAKFATYKGIGHFQNMASEKIIVTTLASYTGKDGIIDGSELQAHWFPEIDADVFISHSHADTDLAKALAGWLSNKFKITSFIDSCVWNYAGDLLRAIDDQHCRHKQRPDSYSYEKRNESTSHVHMMLATALGKMIDKTECLIFLRTPNSISTSDIEEPETHSPWLLYELGLASIIRRENLRRRRLTNLSESKTAGAMAKYNLTKELESLCAISPTILKLWHIRHQLDAPVHALDSLYELTKPKG